MSQVDKNYTLALLRKLEPLEVLEVAQECIELIGISEPKIYADVRAEKRELFTIRSAKASYIV
jgi:hypothetical protein